MSPILYKLKHFNCVLPAFIIGYILFFTIDSQFAQTNPINNYQIGLSSGFNKFLHPEFPSSGNPVQFNKFNYYNYWFNGISVGVTFDDILNMEFHENFITLTQWTPTANKKRYNFHSLKINKSFQHENFEEKTGIQLGFSKGDFHWRHQYEATPWVFESGLTLGYGVQLSQYFNLDIELGYGYRYMLQKKWNVNAVPYYLVNVNTRFYPKKQKVSYVKSDTLKSRSSIQAELFGWAGYFSIGYRNRILEFKKWSLHSDYGISMPAQPKGNNYKPLLNMGIAVERYGKTKNRGVEFGGSLVGYFNNNPKKNSLTIFLNSFIQYKHKFKNNRILKIGFLVFHKNGFDFYFKRYTNLWPKLTYGFGV